MTAAALRTSVIRAVPPALVGAALALLGHRTAALALVVVAATLVVLGLVAPPAAERIDRAIARLATAAATGVSFGLSWLGWLVGLVPAWLFNRTRGRSPLDDGWTSSRSAWTVPASVRARGRTGSPLGAARSGSPDRGVRRLSWVRRVVPLAVLAALVAVPAWAVAERRGVDLGVPLLDGPQRTPPGEPVQARVLDAEEFDGLAVDDYAHEGEPWAPEHFGDLRQLPYSPDFFLGARLGDFQSSTVNIVDGQRVSYAPDDPELTVWFFGGSTMFGIGQRDDHTLPSVITRLAEQDGIRIRAMNFGVAGYVHWQGLERFQQALTSGLELPDLAVFYDGVNDRGLASQRIDVGDRDPDASTRLPASPDERERLEQERRDVEPMPWSDERRDLEVELGAAQYRRGAELVERFGESYGVPVLHVWQPQAFAKRPSPADDPLWERLDVNPTFLPDLTGIYGETRERSGVGPIDLTDALDDVDVPVYFDSSHTNELGARIIGERLYQALRPQLDAAMEQR